MKSKVAVLRQFCTPLTIEEVEIPRPTQGQVLVKLDASGVCGSDVHMYRGEDPRTPLPIVLGHEGVGHIVSIGGQKAALDGVPLREGDFITWDRGVTCGRCFACKVLLKPWLCEHRKTYGINKSFQEEAHLNGCYAEYILLSKETHIFRIESNADPAALVCASCSGATAAHAFDLVKINPGDTVLIQGPGPLGFFGTAFAKAAGADRVIVIGGSENRLELCRTAGATDLINRKTHSREERREMVMQLTNGRGADVAFEGAGVNGAATEALSLLGVGGTLLLAGYAQPAGLEQIDYYADVVKKDVHIQGVWVSDTRHVYQALQLVMRMPEKVGRMITHTFPLEQANEALGVMARKEAVKAVLLP